MSDISPNFDVSEEAEAGPLGDLLVRARHRLQIRMVWGDTETDEPPGGRQPLDHVDLCRGLLARKKMSGGIERSGARAHYRDAQMPCRVAHPGVNATGAIRPRRRATIAA